MTEERRGTKKGCLAIVQPGDYTIDTWDGQRCSERNPRRLMRCEGCGGTYCLLTHWHKHLDSVPMDHFEKAT